MKISAAKAKGRRLCQQTMDMMFEAAPDLPREELRINPASCPGEDIWMGSAARKVFSIAIECKNQETAKVWDWIAQAKKYGKDGRCPVVVFSRNHEKEPYAIISLRDLLFLTADTQHLEKRIQQGEYKLGFCP